MSDPNVRLALRVHDECNGSDVFGSDICTCRPYLIFGVEEAVKEAQKGGSGVVIYFRKEGRALGEVTKYLVYNARKFYRDHFRDYWHVMLTNGIAGKRGTDREQVLNYLNSLETDLWRLRGKRIFQENREYCWGQGGQIAKSFSIRC